MSTTSRGAQAQDDAKRALEKLGYIVEVAWASNRVQWSRTRNDYEQRPHHDFWGVADLIAIHPNDVRLIQVTHPSGAAERVRKMQARVPPAILDHSASRWEVWVRLRNGWQVTRVFSASKKSEVKLDA